MYIWSIKRAQDSLRNRVMSSCEIIPYVIAYLLLISASSELLPRLSDSQENIWSIAISASSVLMPSLGAYYVYLRNGGAGGENFLQRYLVVGWVVTVQWVVALFVIGISFSFVSMALGAPVSNAATPLEFFFVLVAEIFLYYYVGAKVGEIEKTET